MTLSACTVFGDVSVEVAPFEIIETDGAFELRHYKRLVLVSVKMPGGIDRASGPFFKLFNYISGNNAETKKIEMTAPVFMDQTEQVTEAMSFVLPQEFTLTTAPPPLDSEVNLTELRDYTVAVIMFTGFLNQGTIETHLILLQKWIEERGLTITGAAKAAGYNPPFTLPFLRRNEIFVPVERSE